MSSCGDEFAPVDARLPFGLAHGDRRFSSNNTGNTSNGNGVTQASAAASLAARRSDGLSPGAGA